MDREIDRERERERAELIKALRACVFVLLKWTQSTSVSAICTTGSAARVGHNVSQQLVVSCLS